MPDRCACGEDEYGHMPHCPVPLRELVADRDRWIRLWNRLEAAVTHHQKATAQLTSDADEALYAARDRILRAAAKSEEGADG